MDATDRLEYPFSYEHKPPVDNSFQLNTLPLPGNPPVNEVVRPVNEVVRDGIYHELSALELLMYPRSQDIISINQAARSGVLEVIPPEGPFTLLVWGKKRILPIHLFKCEITEQAFDTNLNPIRAKISLGLRILSYYDLRPDHPGFALFLAHQISKETMAKTAISNDLSSTGNGTGTLF